MERGGERDGRVDDRGNSHPALLATEYRFDGLLVLTVGASFVRYGGTVATVAISGNRIE